MVKETVHHTFPLFCSPVFPVGSTRSQRGEEGGGRGGAEGKGGEGNSLSPINIISMGDQNGFCQQNMDPLSREERENEREG